MLRVKEGDEASFAELVRAYQDRLVSIFFHMVGTHEAAEDLAQDVFMRVFRSRRGYFPSARFSTWLFRIANNVALNVRRKQFRQREVAIGTTESGAMLGGGKPLAARSGEMPSRQLDKSELQRVVQEAMETLGDRQRMALLLHKFEGMSYAGVAEIMEVSEPAVKSLLSRAREHLRQQLEPYMQLRGS